MQNNSVKNVNVVPQLIAGTLADFRKGIHGVHYLLPADYLVPLYQDYKSRFKALGSRTTGWDIPMMYALMYRVILNVPSISQLAVVLRHDRLFAESCAFHQQPTNRIDSKTPSPNSLYKFNKRMLACHNAWSTSLHNLVDELATSKIRVSSLVPSVWVEYYRTPTVRPDNKPLSQQEFEAICANNTGVDIIDEYTTELPLSYRSDVRQESALQCLELGLDNLSRDQIIAIINEVKRKFRNNYLARGFREKSLFEKVGGTEKELWEFIADDRWNNS